MLVFFRILHCLKKRINICSIAPFIRILVLNPKKNFKIIGLFTCLLKIKFSFLFPNISVNYFVRIVGQSMKNSKSYPLILTTLAHAMDTYELANQLCTRRACTSQTQIHVPMVSQSVLHALARPY